MLEEGDTVLVALSGGPDSVCMLHILNELRSEFSLGLCVAHFNHKLRPEAALEDAEFARETAKKLGLAYVTSSADVRGFAEEQKLSIEDAARRMRYDFLCRSALSLGANKVAVGHNADDQAETVLMRLIRGSGPQGLAGIPPTRRLGAGDGLLIIRPLINVWRLDIMRYLSKNRLKFRTDETNESPEYLRNRIRLDLIPKLENEYNPQIKRRLASAASTLAAENDFMEAEAKLLAGEVAVEIKPHQIVFDTTLLGTLHSALRNRVFSMLVIMAKPDAPMLEALHYAGADTLICAGRGKLDLPGGLRLETSEGFGLISDVAHKPARSGKAFEIPIGATADVRELSISITTKVLEAIKSPDRLVRMCKPNRQYFDLEAVRMPLEVRFRRPGDSFRPLGARGSKKLKDYFIDKKIPRFLRDRVPILVSNGKIMWVMGHEIDERYRLKPKSGAALRVDYER